MNGANFMYVVVIAWMFVVVLMSAAEAMHNQGTVLGAIFTFLLYGALPLSIVVYVLGAPARNKRRKAAQAAEDAAVAQPGASSPLASSNEVQTGSGPDPDAGGHAPGRAVAPVREES